MKTDAEIAHITSEVDRLVGNIINGESKDERAKALADFCNLLQGQDDFYKRILLLISVMSISFDRQSTDEEFENLADKYLHLVTEFGNERRLQKNSEVRNGE